MSAERPRQRKSTQVCVIHGDPKAADKSAPCSERILETADRLFYGQGIRAVGVDTVAAEIGISKRTLYNYFPSKDALIVAYLSRRLQPPTPPSDMPPVEQILGNFERLERTFAQGVFRGCPFVNAVAELEEPTMPPTRSPSNSRSSAAWFRDLLVRLEVKDARHAGDAAADPGRRRHRHRAGARRA